METILPFKDKDAAIAIIESSDLSAALKQELKDRLKYRVIGEEFVKSALHLPDSPLIGSVLIVSNDRYKLLTRGFLEKAYLHQHEALSYSAFGLDVTSAEVRQNFFNQFNAEVAAEFERHRFKLGGVEKIIINPYTWTLLNEKIRRDAVDYFINTNGADNGGLRAFLSLEGIKDAKQVAIQFAGDRDPAIIERFLRRRLGKKKTGEPLKVPLEDVLHPAIRKRVNTFSVCHGPNCFNAGVSVHQGNQFVQTHISDSRELMRLVYPKYRFVGPTEPLQAGDLLIYRNDAGEITHVSTYVAPISATADEPSDDLVFTKNGLNKFRPYVFQLRSKNEELHFTDKKYRLMAFRIPSPGEQAVNPEGGGWNPAGSDTFYWEYSDLEYPKIKYNPESSLENRKKALEELLRRWLKSGEEQELRRLDGDIRAQDLNYLVRLILANNSKFSKVREILEPIEFVPYGDSASNAKAVAALLGKEQLTTEERRAIRWIQTHFKGEFGTMIDAKNLPFMVVPPKLCVDFVDALGRPIESSK